MIIFGIFYGVKERAPGTSGQKAIKKPAVPNGQPVFIDNVFCAMNDGPGSHYPICFNPLAVTLTEQVD